MIVDSHIKNLLDSYPDNIWMIRKRYVYCNVMLKSDFYTSGITDGKDIGCHICLRIVDPYNKKFSG